MGQAVKGLYIAGKEILARTHSTLSAAFDHFANLHPFYGTTNTHSCDAYHDDLIYRDFRIPINSEIPLPILRLLDCGQNFGRYVAIPLDNAQLVQNKLGIDPRWLIRYAQAGRLIEEQRLKTRVFSISPRQLDQIRQVARLQSPVKMQTIDELLGNVVEDSTA